MKYEEPIVLGENEVHSMILQKLKRESKVLEFGSAAGRMTKLLTEKYGCKVSIVECEKEAFQSAMRYADEGMCTDIEDYEWKKWSGIGFDYILFCDVLEHLRNPKQVLKQTLDLLKDDGSIFLSVPNIGHNDMLVKLYSHRFEYTEEGLLDNTHIRFFAENTLESFVEDTGYVIADKQYKTIPTGMTEQYWKEEFVCPDVLSRALQKRVNGDVYQFVLELKKESSCTSEYEKTYAPVHHIPAHGLLYFDRGNGFSQDDVKGITGTWIQEDTYEFEDEIFLDKNVSKIRMDPVERRMCRIISMECSLGDARIPHKVLIDKKEIVLDADPQLIWEVPTGTKGVSFHVVIQLHEDELFNDTIQYCRQIEERQGIIECENAQYASCISELEQKNVECVNRILGLEQQSTERENHISDLKQQNVEYENHIISLKQKNAEFTEQIIALEKKSMEEADRMALLERKNTEYAKELSAVIHSRSWKYTAFLRKMNDWLLRKRKKDADNS